MHKYESMARILALDYGEKRSGIAVTDELQLIASGLTTVQTGDLIPFLKTYMEKEPLELIVIGEPRRYSGAHPDIEILIRKFIDRLREEIPGIPVERADERFSSKIAVQSMVRGGVKKKDRRNKALIDKVSATVILQSYLSMRR